MPAYPTITIGDAPVEISTAVSSLSYSQLLGTLNSMTYQVTGLYIQASSIRQANAPYQYRTIKTNGELFITNKQGTIDPYQYSPDLDVDMGDDSDLILNNLSVLSFTLYPLAEVQLTFRARTASPDYLIGKNKTDNDTQKNKRHIWKDNQVQKRSPNQLLIAVSIATLLTITGIVLINEIRK